MVACPTDETLSAFVDHALPPVDVDRITEHLDGCAVCMQLVLAVVRAATPATAAGTPSVPPTAPLRVKRRPTRARIGRYQLRALIGAGGMGEVYEAYDEELDRAIAVKVLRADVARDTAAMAERLVRESRLMAKVVHPAVITVHDVGRDDDAVFIAMELIRGETLGAHVARRRAGWRETAALYERAAHGLAAAHAAGIVHRDFKPDNVLVELGRDGRAARVVVTDFGIARLTDAATTDAGAPASSIDITGAGKAIGTPAYMAPEQLRGDVVDARADVFAFCVSLWQGVFGARPFAGRTIDELRAAHATAPRPPRARVPSRLVRALERGLARDPAARWPDLAALAGELAAIVGRRRRVAIAAAALGLVGLGIAGALAIARPAADDPCARGLAALDHAFGPARADAMRAALGSDPDDVAGYMTEHAQAWRWVQLGTCSADRDPVQPAATAACLDARLTELGGVADDIALDHGSDASNLAAEVGDAWRCADPPPGLLTARVPADPALRRRVTALRHRIVRAENLRDRSEFAAAAAAERGIVADAATVWEPVHAEALCALGQALVMSGDSADGNRTLREAAAVAETAHHDYIALDAWMELAQSATDDDGDAVHGLEYADYALATLDRLGRPPDLEARVLSTKGLALIAADRLGDAEVVLRRAADIAAHDAPQVLASTLESLASLYGSQGRYEDAAATYRRAIAEIATSGRPVAVDEIIYRVELAETLISLGRIAEALALARDATARGDRELGSDSLDRAEAHVTLSDALQADGSAAAALAEAKLVEATYARVDGERGEHYGRALMLEARALTGLHRDRDAAAAYERACDIIAFHAGEDASERADCLVQRAETLTRIDRARDALALADQACAVMTRAFGDDNPALAGALYARGVAHADLDERAAAAADLERAVAIYRGHATDPGLLGQAESQLAALLWASDPKRADQLVDDAAARLAAAPAMWKDVRDQVEGWREATR